MDFDFSPEQRQMQQEARRFLSDRCGTRAARAVMERGSDHDEPLWRGIAELGWTGVTIPERYGGLGLGHLEQCLIAEELGRVVAPVPFVSSLCLAAEALLRHGDEAQRSAWLPRLASGEAIGTAAFTEGPGETLPRSPKCRYDSGRLCGSKMPVADGAIADLVVVLAADGSGTGLYLVARSAPGVHRQRLPGIDPARGIARLQFDGAPAVRLGAADGHTLAADLLDRAAAVTAFEQIGGADACLDMARSFTLERTVFGRKLGSYQAIKHKLADAYVGNQIARSNAYYGAWALANDSPSLPLAAALSRVSAIQAYRYIAREGLHIHGGMGFTWEADCHLYYRRAQQLALLLGSEHRWKERMLRHARSQEKAA